MEIEQGITFRDNLDIGRKYTSFEIGEMMATTIRREFLIKDMKEGRFIIQFKGKRKEYGILDGVLK